MKVIKPQRLGVLHRVLEHRRQLHWSVAVLMLFDFKTPSTLLPEVALWKLLAEELGEKIDLTMPKARPEVLVNGVAYPPVRPATACRVRIQVGSMDKALNVFGDRHWKTTVPSDPVPFSEMPVTYENAFGGTGYDLNPLGKGFAPPEERGALHYLPNIEDPKCPVRAPKDRPPPAGFSAYDVMWPQRAATAGTYDERWLAEVYPGFPADMDLSTFNTAPKDQRFAAALQGDEAICIENMHPSIPVIETRLPEVMARCFVTQRREGGDVFREVALSLETVHLFPHVERGMVIFRGTLLVTDEDADDILHLLVAAENAGHPKPTEHYRHVLSNRLDRSKAYLLASGDKELLPKDMAVAPDEGEMQVMKPEGLLRQNQLHRMDQELTDARVRLRAQGIDPDEHGVLGSLPPPGPGPSLEEFPEHMANVNALVEAKKTAVEESRKKAEEDARRSCSEHGINYDALVEAEKRRAGGPPKLSVNEMIDNLWIQLADAQNAGADLSHVEAQLSDPAFRVKLQKAQAARLDMYHRFAHEMPAAMAVDEATRGRVRREIAADHQAGLGFRGRDLTGMSLTGMDLQGADFREALLEAADLSGADLRSADFSGAVLVRANLSRCNFKGAKLPGANLGRACLRGARFEAADMKRVVLAFVDFTDADLTGSDLTGADLSESMFRRTSFVDVCLPEARFIDSDLSELELSGADLSKALFLRVTLTGVSLQGANLTSAVFLGVKATGAVFRGANLTNLRVVEDSVLEDADFRDANLERACLRGQRFAGSDFTSAKMNGVDFTGSDLHGAKLGGVSAKDSRFVKTNLAGADCSRSNFMNGLFPRANLRGTNFQGSNLFRADLLRVQVDQGTRIEGAETGDVRFVGVRRDHAQG